MGLLFPLGQLYHSLHPVSYLCLLEQLSGLVLWVPKHLLCYPHLGIFQVPKSCEIVSHHGLVTELQIHLQCYEEVRLQ